MPGTTADLVIRAEERKASKDKASFSIADRECRAEDELVSDKMFKVNAR